MTFLSDSTKVIQRRNFGFLIPAAGVKLNFVALGDGSVTAADNARSSDNGATWNPNATTLGSSYLVRGPNKDIIALGDVALTHNFKSSDDGATWAVSNAFPASSFTFNAGDYGNGLYVIGSPLGDLYSSPDGVNWTPRVPAVADIQDILWNGTQWMMCGTLAPFLQFSNDGIAWVAWAGGFPVVISTCNALGKFGAALIMGCTTPTGNSILRSLDGGNTWAQVYADLFFTTPSKTAFGSGAMVMGARNAPFVYRSADGINWSLIALPAGSGNPVDVAYHNGVFIAITDTGRVSKSTDLGLTWATTDISGLISNGLSIA